MQFKMIHENYNVADLAKSMAFYEEALPDFATKFTKNISKKRGISKVFLAFFVVV